eukprot:2507289-Amphidinium_carterae.1
MSLNPAAVKLIREDYLQQKGFTNEPFLCPLDVVCACHTTGRNRSASYLALALQSCMMHCSDASMSHALELLLARDIAIYTLLCRNAGSFAAILFFYAYS